MMNLLYSQTITILMMLFIWYNHPLILSNVLVMMSFIYGILMYTSMNTPWLAYILIMVFVSGMMMILIYMSTLASNMVMKKTAPVLNTLITMTASLVLWLISTHFTNTNTLSSLDNKTINHSTEFIYKMFNMPTMEMTLALITYLLILLVISMKIIYKNSNSLRMKK